MFRLPRRCLILVAVIGLMLQGCSAVRLGYGNADSLSRWWIDQYLGMSAEQEVLARERLTRIHAWHRKTQLPEYVAVLGRINELVAGQPAAADMLVLGDRMIRLGRVLAEQATPDIADLLGSVTSGQIDRMAARLAEKNLEYAAEAGLGDGESGQRKARYKKFLERAEYWLGDFSGEQKTVLRQMIDGQAAGSQFWYEERLRRQREWLALARQVQRDRSPREQVLRLLRDYAARFDLPSDPVRLQQAQALRRASAELVVAVLAMATPEQRTHLQHKLGDLMRDFTELSREG